jgi:hypothetical protein
MVVTAHQTPSHVEISLPSAAANAAPPPSAVKTARMAA